jgi:oligosaccharide repeat unit polymerase
MAEKVSIVRWEPELTRRFGLIAGIPCLVLICRLALDEDLTWIAWGLVGAASLLVSMVRWPYGALFLVIAASATPRFFVELFGWKARPEHVAAAIVSIAVGVWLLAWKRQLRFEKLDFFVLAYVGINYISSAFTSSEPASTLRWALLNNLAVLPYFLIRSLVQDLETLRKVFRVFLAVTVAESAYGILCYGLHQAFGTTAGMEVGLYFVDIAAPYGSLFEPNLFGAYSACCAVIFLALYFGNARNRFVCMIGFILGLLATILSFSRAALISLVIAAVWAFWKSREQKNAHSVRLIILIPAAALVLILAATAFRGVLQERLANLFSQGLAEETTITRYILIAESLQTFPDHPMLGSGTASFQLSFDWAKYVPQWAGNPTWVGNVTVRILHDAGLLGLAAFLGFLACLWWKIRGALRGNRELPMLIGISAGALVYGVAFQSTDGTTLAFSWVHFGLLASAATVLERLSHESHRIGGITVKVEQP